MAEENWSEFALFNNDGVVRYQREVDQVMQQNKEQYEPSDFNHFDMSHYCGHDYLIPYMEALGRKDLVIYDFGCGIGGTTRLLAKNYGSHVYGLDYLQGYLDVQNRINQACGLSNYTLFAGDAQTVKATDIGISGQADIVISIQVCIYIPNKLPAFQHVYDSLKPGGIFYIEDFGRRDDTELNDEERKCTEVGVFNGVLTVSEYRGLLEQAGFVVESYNDRSKEWSRYVFNRSNNHIKDGDELKAQLGEAWYNEFALKWSGESVWKLYHDVDMTIEEVEEKFPHLVSHNGRETVERILNSPQKMSGNYFVCRKPEN